MAWGLKPGAWHRNGGLTLLTSFLLHASVLHIVGNMYFLLIFGDNVEDHLGRGRYIALLLGAHLAGVIAHAFLDFGSMVPLVGASAGISGVIAYYAVTFPRAKLGFAFFIAFRFLWLRLPAYAAFVLWIVLQFVGTWEQIEGSSNVSSLAHLGGAALGLVVALIVRHRRRCMAKGVVE
jgi:membrane associated rhomboid family serine protease